MHSIQELDCVLNSMMDSILSCRHAEKEALLIGYIEKRLSESLDSYRHDLMLNIGWIDRINSIRAMQIVERNT